MPTDLVLFGFIVVSLLPFLGMVLSSDLMISVPSATLSFICWAVTAIVYMYTYPTFTGPGLLFMLFAAISAIVAVYGGVKIMNPYERESLRD